MHCSQCGHLAGPDHLYCVRCGHPLKTPVIDPAASGQAPAPVPTPAPAQAASTGSPAGFWIRAVALLIDCIVLQVAFTLIGHGDSSLSPASWDEDFLTLSPATDGIDCLLSWLYWAFCESSSWQGTVGKRALGLKVVDVEGQRISFGRATLRFFAQILSSLFLLMGYVMAAFTLRKQALHDMIAGTYVLNAER